MPTHSHASRRACAAVAIVIGMVAGGCAQAAADRSPQPLPPNRIADGITVDPDPTRTHAVPASGLAEQGVIYRFRLYSHCGIAYWIAWDFDGSFWDPIDVTGNAASARLPQGIDDPEDDGMIELTRPDRARYMSSGGVIVELMRSPEREREGTLCM